MKRYTLIYISAIVVLIGYFVSMLSPVLYTGKSKINPQKTQQILITGHRGAAGLAPENTLLSIKKALDLKVDRIEVDVRQTKDYVVVCMHDETVSRTTSGKGAVCEYRYSSLMKLDAGIKFSRKYSGEKIPSLEEVIRQVKGKSKLIIEIKDGNELYPGIEERVVNLINKYNAKGWAFVHSFNDSVLVRINKIDEKIVLHKLLIADFPLFYLIYDGNFRVTNLEFYNFVDEFSCYYPFTTKRLIKKVHDLGKKINVWTVNDSIAINRLINLGVDGIITDYPNFVN